MAEGGFDLAHRKLKVQQLCRYFIHGACERGDHCKFVHDRTGTTPANNVCKFYQQGKCSYGKECRYDHVRASQPNRPETNSKSRRNRGQSSDESRQEGRKRNDSDNWEPRGGRKRDDSDNWEPRGGRKRDDSDNWEPRGGRKRDDSDNWEPRGGRKRDDSDNWEPRGERKGNDSDDWKPSFVTLKKGVNKQPEQSVDNKQSDRPKSRVLKKNWAKAKDFVPGQKYHAGATYARKAQDPEEDNDNVELKEPRDPTEEELMCPYYAHGNCPYGQNCSYIHGQQCDICQLPRLHPTNTAQQQEHRKECLEEMEKNMELSFAVQESQKKECCICLEVVLEKSDKEPGGSSKKSRKNQQFGILENCVHCFCLDCIRRWRGDKTFGKNARVCPICRVHSDFVTPSSLWVEEEEAKKKVIQDYKDALRLKHCQYFKQGKGECPFNEKCFYKHAYPDGTIAKPKPRTKPRRQVNADGELNVMDAISIWDFLERRDDGFISLEDELSLYLLDLLHDSDDYNHWNFSDGSSSDSDAYLLEF